MSTPPTRNPSAPPESGRASKPVPRASEWPIAAAMLQFPNVHPDGSSVQDDPADAWAATLTEVADAGFTEVDPTDSWLRIADLSAARLEEFVGVVKECGLTVPAVSTARRSVIDPEFGDENLAYCHRVVDAAAAVGATVVSIAFMRALTPAQQQALWFWTAQGAKDSDDPDVWALAVSRARELGTHAEAVGLEVSLEMYEDTLLGSADSSVRFITDVDHPAVGLNPDLANLFRLHRPMESWQSMAAKTLPYANYWHVKNYARMEDATTGAIMTTPVSLESGVMNYRQAVRTAIAHGFRGPFCAEHYGGDGLSVSATNREYLRRLLPR